jgi:hypothetical protein
VHCRSAAVAARFFAPLALRTLARSFAHVGWRNFAAAAWASEAPAEAGPKPAMATSAPSPAAAARATPAAHLAAHRVSGRRLLTLVPSEGLTTTVTVCRRPLLIARRPRLLSLTLISVLVCSSIW